ncbi:MAG TPA: hypothetical protein VGX16_04970, partial [Solirubrobacteraceae bacterium]|nr:hypothetical protein [Solirubrobacteraceae bacterium]
MQGAPASHAGAAAQVAGAPIAAAGYRHWVAVERALGAGGSPDHQALGFLITSEWIVHEAAARHITVSDAEVRRRFEELVHRSFPKPGELQKYLARAHETEADLLVRIRIELLTQRILAQVAAGKSGSERAAALRRFQAAFKQRWKQLTSCSPGYVMEDCREYKGGPEKLAARPHAPAASAASSP